MPTPLSRRRYDRALASVIALLLAVGLVGAVRLQTPATGPSTTVSGGATPTRTAARTSARLEAVKQLLEARARAVVRRDRAAFLATVDPSQPAFVARQAAVFDAMAAVRFASWTYEVDPATARPPTAALDARRGTWWAPGVTLRYALAGYDRSPTLLPQGLTFVARGDRWLLAADDDFAATGHPTSRELWDGGAVVSAQGRSCLVLGHPASLPLVRALAGECDAAVPRVTAVWGRHWSQRVVLEVPGSATELARIVPGSGDLSQIAALATAELAAPATGYHPVGDRVLVNPGPFAALGALGRRVVLTHELTHVASRASTGPQVPTWFVEGLADYVGYRGVDLPLSESAQELRADVRRGALPGALPRDVAFDGSRRDLAQTYEMSWLAVVMMSRLRGQAAMLKAYRDTGADSAPGALDRAMRADLHETLGQFTTAWRADLRTRLA